MILSEEEQKKVLKIYYKNWKDETSDRLIYPTGEIEFKSTDYHPEPQWLVSAKDVSIVDGKFKCSDKIKQFALKDFVHIYTFFNL